MAYVVRLQARTGHRLRQYVLEGGLILSDTMLVAHGGRSKSDYFADDLSASRLGIFQFLQHQGGGALAEHRPGTMLIERPAELRRVAVADGDFLLRHNVDRAGRMNLRARGPGKHTIGVAADDRAIRLGYRQI